jgi:hypothetical protein
LRYVTENTIEKRNMSSKQMVMTLLAPGIGVAKLPPNVRNECFSIVKDSIDDFLVHGAVSKLNTDGSYSSVVDLSIRNCYSFGLNFFTGCHEDDPSMKLRALLDSSLPSVIQKFTSHYGMHELIKNHDWIVLKYDKSNFFKNHIDDSPSFSRTLSVLIYLNDEYTGGELVFDNFDVSYRPSAGDVVIFSSAFPYRHRVEEITDGVRYVIVNWFSYAKIEK